MDKTMVVTNMHTISSVPSMITLQDVLLKPTFQSSSISSRKDVPDTQLTNIVPSTRPSPRLFQNGLKLKRNIIWVGLISITDKFWKRSVTRFVFSLPRRRDVSSMKMSNSPRELVMKRSVPNSFVKPSVSRRRRLDSVPSGLQTSSVNIVKESESVRNSVINTSVVNTLPSHSVLNTRY